MDESGFRLGGREARISVPPGASETILFAAEQLGYYLAIITAGRFAAGERPGELRLSVGGDCAPGGYRISVAAESIEITGADDLALLHGVYHFLETKCGCRWLAGFEGGEIVPRDTALVAPPGDERHAPVFSHRAFTNFPDIDQRTVEMVDWMCKNRFNRFMVFANLEGSWERYREVLKPHLALRGMKVELGHHSFRYWLPPGEFFAEHPEWYAEIEGRRTPEAQICTANPAVAEAVARRINEFFAANPEVDMVGLWPNDGYGWCQCAECARLEAQRPSELFPSQPARTDTYVQFVNRVAGLVAAEHPMRHLTALAYVNYVEPPTLPMAENVAVCFAPMHRCFKHPLNAPPECRKDNARYAALFAQWREKVAGELYLFCYLMEIDICSVPYRITRMLGPNFRWAADDGCDGYVMEFKPEEWGPFGVNAHLIGQLSWDPDLDVEAWLAGYYRDLYGPAAEEMGAFWEACLDDFVEPGPCVYHYDLTYARRATHELLQPALNHLGRARARAATGEKRDWEAVERAQVGAELLLRMGEWQRALAEAGEGDEAKRRLSAERARRLGEELIVWAKAHGGSGAVFAPRIEGAVRAAARTLGYP